MAHALTAMKAKNASRLPACIFTPYQRRTNSSSAATITLSSRTLISIAGSASSLPDGQVEQDVHAVDHGLALGLRVVGVEDRHRHLRHPRPGPGQEGDDLR